MIVIPNYYLSYLNEMAGGKMTQQIDKAKNEDR